MSEQRNFIVAIILCTLVIFGWQILFPPPKPPLNDPNQATEQIQSGAQTNGQSIEERDLSPTPDGNLAPSADPSAPSALTRDLALQASKRIYIDAPRISGSIALTGAILDDLQLKGYREELPKDSDNIKLLQPKGMNNAYFSTFGWLNAGGNAKLPNLKTQWSQVGSNNLTPTSPVTLTWENGEGLLFTRTIAIDENFMFTITDEVQNNGTATVNLTPYGQIFRYSLPETSGIMILHEGMVGVADGTLKVAKYKKMAKEGKVELTSTGGWLGITDKYWLTAIIPAQTENFKGWYKYYPPTVNSPEIYTTEYVLPAREVTPGGVQTASRRFFAGAKEVETISSYQIEGGVTRFDLAVDWGRLFFLTKPFFWALHKLGLFFGNFGIGILLLTVLIKIAFFPLANKSYEAMSKMKKVQPEMVKIRERFADDKVKQNQELMELYKKEKVNPMAGCLPMLIQIPVFFALYKVLYGTIEMRHTPFFGWIQDLSAPDPTNIFNLFGLIPWTPPEFIPVIGIWPLIMGFTMWFQMKLNPAPADPMQEKIFAFMPFIFVIILAPFSAGLVIYWAWNNSLSILQQYVIMRRMGVDINLGERIKMPGWIKNLRNQVMSPATANASAGSESASPGTLHSTSSDKTSDIKKGSETSENAAEQNLSATTDETSENGTEKQGTRADQKAGDEASSGAPGSADK